MPKKLIGISLGTSNSVVAILEEGKPVVINNAEGSLTTSSIVAISETGERLVGRSAKLQATTNPENTVFGIKRLLGRKFESAEVQHSAKILPYIIEQTSNGSIRINLRGQKYSPEEITSFILAQIKKYAEDYLGEKISDAVISVPANFNSHQRKATMDAGEIAGLNVLRIINEPTAACLAYGIDKRSDEKIAVFDLGGGTFDISIFHIGEGVYEAKATNGDTYLGGEDFDQRLIDYLASEFQKDQGIGIRSDKIAFQKLKEGAEKAKIELSNSMATVVNLPLNAANASGPKHLNLKITRPKFESLTKDLLNKLEALCRTAIKDADYSADEINKVILVGGMTRMPAVQELVKKIFFKEPYKRVNSDEVVAIGAAIQSGIFNGAFMDVLLLDVIPHSLGIETLGGVMTKLINKNGSYPTSKSQVFSTAADNQPALSIHVLQGDREMAQNNESLGRFELVGIPPAPKGVPQIEVTYFIDINGIVNVSAKDLVTGKEQSIQITDSLGLSKREINKLKRDSKTHAEEDKKKRKIDEVNNSAESPNYQKEKTIKDKDNKIFISYRREDSADVTGRIYDRLVQYFEKRVIFKDVDSIPLGLDFRKFIDGEVSKCNILLVIIGKEWLSIKDSKNNRRIEKPGDFVRIEIESGLNRNIPVIPILVGNASMPLESYLPESIKNLAFRNAIVIRTDPDFHRDVDRLITGIKKLLNT